MYWLRQSVSGLSVRNRILRVPGALLVSLLGRRKRLGRIKEVERLRQGGGLIRKGEQICGQVLTFLRSNFGLF